MGSTEMDFFGDKNFDYDPMAKDYNCPKFNSYTSGPGSLIDRDLQTHKGWKKKQEGFCLYITNLPPGVNRNGLLNLFCNFGEPLHASINTGRNNFRYAHVEFRTLYEAQKAVMGLHKSGPLYLSVKFAKKSKETTTEEIDDTLDTLAHLSLPQSSQQTPNVEKIEEGSLMGIKGRDMVSLFRRSTHYLVSSSKCGESNREGLFELPMVDEVLLAYHQAINYMKPVITSDGLYLLNMGRRILLTTIHSTPAYSPTSNKIMSFSNEFESTIVGCYKKCSACGERAARICINCRSYFCSKLCFRLSPPNHTLHSSGSVLCRNVGVSKHNICPPNSREQQGIEVTKLVLAPLNSSSEGNDVSQCKVSSKCNKQTEAPYRYSYLTKSRFIQNHSLPLQHTSLLEKGTLSVGKVISQAKQDMSQQMINCPISPLTFTQVVVSYIVKPHHYYVNLLSQRSEKLQLKQLLKTSKTQRNVEEPVIGEYYASIHRDQWERVQVSCAKPLTLFHIDSGKEEAVEKSRSVILKELPSSASLTQYPPLAHRIRIITADSELLNSIKITTRLSIKLIKKEERDTFVVKVESDDSTISEPVESVCQNNSENLSKLCLGLCVGCKEFYVTVSSVRSDSGVSGSLDLNPSYQHSSLNDISSQLVFGDSTKIDEKLEPGSLVSCEAEGLKGRGYVMSIFNKLVSVALVDHGVVVKTTQCCHKVPSSLTNIPHLSVSCSFSHPHKNLTVGTRLHCRDPHVVNGRVLCQIEGYGECVLSAWMPRVEDGGLATVRIDSGSKVIISSVHSPKAVYIQSVESYHLHQFQTLLQDLAAYAVSAPPLGREPEKEELVLSLSPDDSNYYRAQVIGRRDDSFSVIFVDYGSLHLVRSHDMKLLCDSFKMVDCFAMKIYLKGVEEDVLTPDAVHFLNMKASNNDQFFLEYDDEHGSTLISSQGVNINVKISEMIDPVWKSRLAANEHPTNDEVFFGSDVTYVEWDLKVEMKVLVVKKASVNCILVINVEDGLLEFIVDWLTPRVSLYCSSFPDDYQYTPRMGELCLVLMKDSDDWFRAICLETHQHFCWVVLIDFGNHGPMDYKRVRPLPEEFIKQPSILKKCFVAGVPDVLPSEECGKRLDKMLSLGSVHQIIPLEEKTRGVVNASFKVVSENAKNLGLDPIPYVSDEALPVKA